MRIDFYVIEGSDIDPIASCNWDNVPRAGESVTLRGVSYTVNEVGWGHHVDGEDNPLFDKPCVDITLNTIKQKRGGK